MMAELARGKSSHLCLQTSVPEHLNYLRVFLAILFENQLSLLIVVLVLASTTVLTTLFEGASACGLRERICVIEQAYLSLVLRHDGNA